MENCAESCGCGMPCTLKNHMKDQTGMKMHACDVHFPQLHKLDEQKDKSPFQDVKLVSGAGLELVAYGEIPPFNVLPQVLTWGNRVFQLIESTKEADLPEYVEVFAVAVVQWKRRMEDEATYGGGQPRLAKFENDEEQK